MYMCYLTSDMFGKAYQDAHITTRLVICTVGRWQDILPLEEEHTEQVLPF